LNKALEIQKLKRVSLRRVLVDEGFIREEELMGFLATHLLIPTLRLGKYSSIPRS
jgi:hypothetical protein